MARTWDTTRARTYQVRPGRLARAVASVDRLRRRLHMAWAVLSTLWGWSDQDLAASVWVLQWWPTASVEARGVVTAASQLVGHPCWLEACHAVAQTSHTRDLNRRHTWAKLSQLVKDQGPLAQSMWRHIYAMRLLEQATGPRLTHGERHALIELAYLHHRQFGRRARGVSADLR